MKPLSKERHIPTVEEAEAFIADFKASGKAKKTVSLSGNPHVTMKMSYTSKGDFRTYLWILYKNKILKTLGDFHPESFAAKMDEAAKVFDEASRKDSPETLFEEKKVQISGTVARANALLSAAELMKICAYFAETVATASGDEIAQRIPDVRAALEEAVYQCSFLTGD